MTAVTLWLLVSLGGRPGHPESVPTTTVAVFVTAAECDRVRVVLSQSDERRAPPLRCVQAALATVEAKEKTR